MSIIVTEVRTMCSTESLSRSPKETCKHPKASSNVLISPQIQHSGAQRLWQDHAHQLSGGNPQAQEGLHQGVRRSAWVKQVADPGPGSGIHATRDRFVRWVHDRRDSHVLRQTEPPEAVGHQRADRLLVGAAGPVARGHESRWEGLSNPS